MKKVVFVTSILLAVSMAMTACGGTAAKSNTMAKTAPLSGSVFNNTSAADAEAMLQGIIGTYSNGRAMMTVSARGNDKAAIYVTWGSSAAASSSWMMTGTAIADGDKVVVTYEDCMKTDILFDENGVAEENTVYENGKGTLTFSGSEVVWNDQVEGIADGAVFTYYSAD